MSSVTYLLQPGQICTICDCDQYPWRNATTSSLIGLTVIVVTRVTRTASQDGWYRYKVKIPETNQRVFLREYYLDPYEAPEQLVI
jgi:hypothetical protein